MHTVACTEAFLKTAAAAGMSEAAIEALTLQLAANPTAGDEIVGTGGCRKLRLAGRGKGKSGGYRIVTFYSGETIPAFLLTVFSKGERADVSQRERNALADMTKAIVAAYKRRVVKIGERK
jgi:hypothetical protein